MLSKGWEFKSLHTSEYLPAVVPGTVHTDLLSNKKIVDPYLYQAEPDLQWISDSTWEYRLVFECTIEELSSLHQMLVFQGLDTYAKVWLNDSLVLEANNMFRSWDLDVKGILRQENTIRVIFEPTSSYEKNEAAKLPYTLSGEHRVFSRKAQYQYGWDWGPRYITCGIWKPVHLITSDNASILNVNAVQEQLDDSLAQLRFVSNIDCFVPGFYMIELQPLERNLPVLKQTAFLQAGPNMVDLPYSIPNPERWWCNGMGNPAMYRFYIRLKQADKLCSESKVSLGLRTLELIREPDSLGVSFYFKLNGLPVFMKGANWVPADNFAPRVSNEKYVRMLQEAVSANMNMLRVWGGGYYESDVFYDLCDQYGLFVWQDFMFACAMYPGDASFTANVEQEVTQQVQRLRNHPSIALWCGNNEIAEGWNNWGWQKEYRLNSSDSSKINADYENLFNGLIPGLLSVLDPPRPYIPSSPELGWGRAASRKQGDSHYWGVWWGMEPFEKYREKTGRFMSEYGFQGIPRLSTLKKCCGDSSLSLANPCVQAHQKHPRGFQTIEEYMLRDYDKPSSFADYIYVSQLLQAHGMQTAIESHRKRMPYCMGSLLWQFNDCWPVTSWSLIDSEGNRKAAYYQVKRSFEKVLISLEEVEDKRRRKFFSSAS
jgi:beta-mannosidase